MPDKMCEGGDCPIKENCLRFKEFDQRSCQPVFDNVPYDHVEGDCNQYWFHDPQDVA